MAIGTKTAYYTYSGGDGNDFTLTVQGAVSVSASGNLTLKRVTGGSSDNVELLAGTTVVDSRPYSTVTGSYTVNGGSGDDTLTIDYDSLGSSWPVNISFNGDGGTDALVISGSTFAKTVYNYTNGHDGSIQDYSPAATLVSTITYTGLSPITNSGIVADIVMNLPTTVASDASLEDDGTSGNDTTRLRSTNATPTFEQTTFKNPTNSLTIGAGNAASTLTVAASTAPWISTPVSPSVIRCRSRPSISIAA